MERGASSGKNIIECKVANLDVENYGEDMVCFPNHFVPRNT